MGIFPWKKSEAPRPGTGATSSQLPPVSTECGAMLGSHDWEYLHTALDTPGQLSLLTLSTIYVYTTSSNSTVSTFHSKTSRYLYSTYVSLRKYFVCQPTWTQLPQIKVMFFAHKKYLRNFILFVLKYLSISTRNLQTSNR